MIGARLIRPLAAAALALAVATGCAAAQTAAAGDPSAPGGGRGDLSMTMAVLGGLDKITARVVTIEAPVGEPVRFGTLEIIARACQKRRPEENPESAAFLDIWDTRPGQPAQSVFRGWMFASSPALSAMEHPVFDIWVLDCRNSR